MSMSGQMAGYPPYQGRASVFSYGFIPPGLFAQVKAESWTRADKGGVRASGVERASEPCERLLLKVEPLNVAAIPNGNFRPQALGFTMPSPLPFDVCGAS